MISRGKEMKQQARSKRLSAALRENLKRRKAQARGRAAEPWRRRSRAGAPFRSHPTFAAIGAAIRNLGPGWGHWGDNGPYSHRRWAASHRHDTDLGSQERHAPA